MSPWRRQPEKKAAKEEKKAAEEKKGAKQEKKAVNQEIELGEILAEIVSNEANKLFTERGEYYRDLVHNGTDAQGIVRALIKELERLLNENRRLAPGVGNDNGTTQEEYEREISDLNWDHSKKIQEYEDRIDRFAKEVSQLRSINDAQRREAHEKEQRSLQEHNAEKIRLQNALNAEKEAFQRLQ